MGAQDPGRSLEGGSILSKISGQGNEKAGAATTLQADKPSRACTSGGRLLFRVGNPAIRAGVEIWDRHATAG